MPKRILHVEVGGSYGGSLKALETYLLNCDQARLSHDVLLYFPTSGLDNIKKAATVLPPLYGLPNDRESAKSADHAKSRVTEQVSTKFGHAAELISTIDKLRQVIRRNQYELVHINNTFSYQLPTAVAARTLRVPSVAHARNPVTNNRRSRFGVMVLGGIIAVNNSIATTLKTWIRSTPVYCCYDGIPVPRCDPNKVEKWRGALVRDSGGEVLVGSVGRLDVQKGYEDLIRAARVAVDARPELRFAIAGDGPLRQHLDDLVKDLRLTREFRFVGFQEDAGNFIGALDAFVCSSLWEGGPYSVVEAMMLRKPVVSTAVGFVPEFLPKNSMVPPNSHKALAGSILECLLRPDHVAANEIARRKAMSVTDPRHNARMLDDLFDKS